MTLLRKQKQWQRPAKNESKKSRPLDGFFIQNPLTNVNMLHIIQIDDFQPEVKTVEIDEKRTAEVFKALCDENRVRILKLLLSGEKCACKLLEALDITQPTLSHHMKILCDSGIVVGRKEGKWMHYSISKEGADFAKACLDDITDVRPDRCC